MNVILNIGLDPPNYSQDWGWSPHERLAHVHREAPLLFVGRKARLIVHQSGLLMTAVLVGTINELVKIKALGAIGVLAQRVNQDSIAVWDCDSGAGYLCGPHSERWMPFRRDLFVFPYDHPENPQ